MRCQRATSSCRKPSAVFFGKTGRRHFADEIQSPRRILLLFSFRDSLSFGAWNRKFVKGSYLESGNFQQGENLRWGFQKDLLFTDAQRGEPRALEFHASEIQIRSTHGQTNLSTR